MWCQWGWNRISNWCDYLVFFIDLLKCISQAAHIRYRLHLWVKGLYWLCIFFACESSSFTPFFDLHHQRCWLDCDCCSYFSLELITHVYCLKVAHLLSAQTSTPMSINAKSLDKSQYNYRLRFRNILTSRQFMLLAVRLLQCHNSKLLFFFVFIWGAACIRKFVFVIKRFYT